MPPPSRPSPAARSWSCSSSTGERRAPGGCPASIRARVRATCAAPWRSGSESPAARARPPRDGGDGQHQQLGGAERIARRKGEGEPERQDLERGAPAGPLGDADGGEPVARERRLERAEVLARDERRGVEGARAGVGGGELRHLERRVGLEDEDRAVAGEGRSGFGLAGGGRRLRRGALHRRALRGERGEETQEERIERGVGRGEPDRERLWNGWGALD